MTADDQPSLAEQLQLAWGDTDTASRNKRFDRVLAEDYVRHSDDTTLDRDAFEGVVTELLDAFPDLSMSMSDSVREGERIAFRWESVGTHTGVYLGVEPTHQRVVARGMTMGRVVDERIVEEWTSWDKASVLTSMGILQLR